ncbi:MAG: hypothetical protein ACI4TB_06570, partial [Lachnospiraceae bacterium]
STVTLSRIENNTQKPSLKVEEALLEKLGCSTENLVFYASDEEAAKHRLETELTVLAMHRQPVEEKLSEYKGLIANRGAGSNMEKQFALMIEAIHAYYTEEWDLQRIFNQQEEALLLTIPNYKEKNIESIKLLTLTEITIINNMALVLYKQERTLQAIRILTYLVEYVEKSDLSVETMGKRYPMLVFNLAKMMGQIKEFEKMLFLCEKGIDFCKKYARLVGLPEFCFYKAVACTELSRIEDALESYEYAISLYKLIGRPELAEQSQKNRDALLKCKCI